jgi:hypothetical protein
LDFGPTRSCFSSIALLPADTEIVGDKSAQNRETHMLRTILAIAVAGLIFAAVSGTAQATPITPIPVSAFTDLNILTDVAWASLLARPLGSPPLSPLLA